jgi:two-component sensor histidine kinase/HAMP domain-containing protein
VSIRTSSYVAFAVSVLAAVFIVGTLFVTHYRSDLTARKTAHIGSILQAVHDRRVVQDKYLRYHRDELAIESQVLHEGTVALLDAQEFQAPEERAILEDMREDNAETKRLFASLVALHDLERSGKQTPESTKAAEERLVSRLWLLGDTLQDGASRLNEISVRERRATLRANEALGLVSVVVLLALVFSILSFVSVKIVRRLTALNDVIKVIAGRNWDRRIGDVGSDELGRLAASFDRMVDELQHAYVEQQMNERQLRASLDEKEILLKEVHHRVKNNLQIISSLLRLQARRVSEPSSRVTLQESQNRIYSIALVHEQLYRLGELRSIQFRQYARSLAATLVSMYMGRSSRVSVDVSGANVELGVDVAVPCGLIVNELLTNSLKHGFPDARTGRVWVSLAVEADGNVLLDVGDDGVGLPSNRDWSEYSSLGLQLVRRLVAQLRGSVEVTGNEGVRFLLRFDRSQSQIG